MIHPDDYPSRAELSADAHEEGIEAATNALMTGNGAGERAAKNRLAKTAIDAYLEALNAH